MKKLTAELMIQVSNESYLGACKRTDTIPTENDRIIYLSGFTTGIRYFNELLELHKAGKIGV